MGGGSGESSTDRRFSHGDKPVVRNKLFNELFLPSGQLSIRTAISCLYCCTTNRWAGNVSIGHMNPPKGLLLFKINVVAPLYHHCTTTFRRKNALLSYLQLLYTYFRRNALLITGKRCTVSRRVVQLVVQRESEKTLYTMWLANCTICTTSTTE